MQQFVDNHVIPELPIQMEQFVVEVEMTRRGARRPFVLMGRMPSQTIFTSSLSAKRRTRSLNSLLWDFASIGSDPVCLFQKGEKVVHDPRYGVEVVDFSEHGEVDHLAELAQSGSALLPVWVGHELP